MTLPVGTAHKSILKTADDIRARIIIYGLDEAARQLKSTPSALRNKLRHAGMRWPRNAWKPNRNYRKKAA